MVLIEICPEDTAGLLIFYTIEEEGRVRKGDIILPKISSAPQLDKKDKKRRITLSM